MSGIDPLKPKTFLPACTACSAEDSSPDEAVCEKCQGVIVACDFCYLCIRGCDCGNCPTGSHINLDIQA